MCDVICDQTISLLLRTILILFQDTVDNTLNFITNRPRFRPVATNIFLTCAGRSQNNEPLRVAQTLRWRTRPYSLASSGFAPKCKGLSLRNFAPAQADSPAASVGIIAPAFSENAVKTQIWIAVSVYVLVAIVKKRLDLDASLYTLLQILSVTLFEKMPIHQALAGDENRCNASQITNQLNLFDF